MASLSRTKPGQRTFLLTGVTGFVGKVVLEELVRRRDELSVAKVRLVIRGKGAHAARDRFAREVAASPCFAGLPPGWTELVDVVEADLEKPGLGLAGGPQELDDVTHIVHAAASISFDLPIQDAARANVVTALGMLDLARQMPRLERMVYISTAYVTPHDGATGSAPEALARLPRPADGLFADIQAGRLSEKQALRDSGHPNTYTLTKSIAEHLLVQRRGDVPLSIVRPSVVAASRSHPFPGWVDSTAGFGGFVLMLGLGHLRAVVGKADSRLDLIPVDEVAHRAIAAALAPASEPVRIRHATAGRELSPTLMDCWSAIEDFFGRHQVQRRPTLRYMGPRDLGFHLADLLHHRMPMAMASMGGSKRRRKARSLHTRLAHLNRAFPYFTSNSFTFEVSEPLAGFEPKTFLPVAVQGMHRHVLRQARDEWIMAGRKHFGNGGDFAWSFRQPHGNLWIRLASWQTTKVLRKTLDQVTVDLPSFEAARKQVPDGSAVVIVATHRSYLDFVLVSYLAFARPDLHLPIPYIAATMEFGKIPVLGRVLRALHAFYLRRGTGKEDPELTRRVHDLLGRGRTLEFFIEGSRSRTRAFLEPKRGLLRCIQATGAPVTILPVALSYDRVPEEASFAAELAGAPKPKMRLSSFLRWVARAHRGQVALGRAHLACGQPVRLGPESDVPAVGQEVMRQLRQATVTTTFHIEAYLAAHPQPGLDPEGLRRAIESRGGRVLDSSLEADGLDPLVAATLRNQFAHLLDGEPVTLSEREEPAVVLDSVEAAA